MDDAKRNSRVNGQVRRIGLAKALFAVTLIGVLLLLIFCVLPTVADLLGYGQWREACASFSDAAVFVAAVMIFMGLLGLLVFSALEGGRE